MTTAARIDVHALQASLLELLALDTGVPEGATEIAPGDPRIVAAVDEVVLPALTALDPAEVRRHPLGDAAVRFGPPGDDGLLLQTYVVTQHANLMADPLAARIVDGAPHGVDGPAAVGRGASQSKGPLAAALAAVAALDAPLARPLWVTVNTEGRSSHGGSQRLLDDLGVRAAWGVLAFGTDLAVSLGNRGRVDVVVTVAGESCHSSQPHLGRNPIEGAADVVAALRATPLPPPHPDLGPATATPYQLVCSPVAPHTIPSQARLVVDRRLLPGEEPEAAVAALAAHLGASVDWPLDVRQDVVMLPAAVTADAPVVRALVDGVAAQRGSAPAPFWSRNTFDAGYACAKGIPTVMFGPGRRAFGADVTAAEVVAVDDCRVAAEALHHAITTLCC